VDIYNENNEKLSFYLSGLISFSFTFLMLYLFLSYGYHKKVILNVKIKPVEVELLNNGGVAKPEPKPIPKPEPKPISKPEPKPIPKPEPPSLSSLFSNIKTGKIDNKVEEEPPPPTVSKESLNRLKSLSKTRRPIEEERNLSANANNFVVERNFKYSDDKALSVEYEELEIGKTSLDDKEQGIYDQFFSRVKESLYAKWHPSSEVAGNRGKVRIVIGENGEMLSYRILIYGKSKRFNFELEQFLQRIKGDKIADSSDDKISFEVFIGAKN
jgi:hypothetical protein